MSSAVLQEPLVRLFAFSINSTLTLEWAEDVETKLCNEVVLMAQEEVIFPIYMPWAFAYGDLAALKTAITKA